MARQSPMDAEHRLSAPAHLRNTGGLSFAAAAPAPRIAEAERRERARWFGHRGFNRLALIVVGAGAVRLVPAAVHSPTEVAPKSVTDRVGSLRGLSRGLTA